MAAFSREEERPALKGEGGAPGKAPPASAGETQRRPYAPPRVLSVEPLEAVASICDGSGGYGKSLSGGCQPGKLGS